MESSFLYQCTRCIDSFDHPDLAPIMVFLECLTTLEVRQSLARSGVLFVFFFVVIVVVVVVFYGQFCNLELSQTSSSVCFGSWKQDVAVFFVTKANVVMIKSLVQNVNLAN